MDLSASLLPAVAVRGLPDHELESRLKHLAGFERKALTVLLAHLGEFDRRRLFADRGQPSLFRYCVSVLGYSEQAAYKRIQAARAAREHPAVLEHLWQGKLHLAAIVVLAPHFRKENLQELLAAAQGKSKLELEELASGLAPRPDAPELIRALPFESPAPPLVEASDESPVFDENPGSPVASPVTALTSGPPREKVEPLSPGRFLFRFTGSAAFQAKFTRARELRLDSGNRRMERIFEAALDALLERSDPEIRLKRRESRKAAAAPRRSTSRMVPKALRDDVWRRDGGRCAFVTAEGFRCPATGRLEIDHIQPYALGGRSDDAGNLRLLCRAHNLLMARWILGTVANRKRRDYPRG